MQVWLERGAAWLIFGAVLVVTWFVAALARRITKAIIVRAVSKKAPNLEKRLTGATTTPVRLLVFAIGLRFGLDALTGQFTYLARSVAFIWAEKLMGLLLVLAVTAVLNSLLLSGLDWYLHEMAARNQATWDEELLPVARRVISLLLYFIAVSIILKNFGQDITALVTTAGVASLAIALAAQETLSNMLGGFVILVDRPFKAGDVVELTDGKSGEVVNIGLRSTRIRLADGNLLVAPNRDLANSRIINVLPANQRGAIRGSVVVSQDTDVDTAEAAMLTVLRAHPDVLKEPAPTVTLNRFAETGLELLFSGWVMSAKERNRVTDELNRAILHALRGAHVEIARK